MTNEQKMIEAWVETWLKARARGDKEISINEMMRTATEVAYNTQLFSDQAIKVLQSHQSESGRQRYLRERNAYINPKKVEMPAGEPAYIFPFSTSLLREFDRPELVSLLDFDSFPPLLDSIKPANMKTVFILLHVDDVNLANPLGSKKKKHSIRIFQWQLYNVPSWYKSKLEAKHPLAIANAASFKRNPEKAWKIILEDFLYALKKYKDGGLFVPSLDENVALRLGSLLGDGLGMFEMLGLSMSFGNHSSHVCFRCHIAGGTNLNWQCQPPDFQRTREATLADCQKIAMAPKVKVRSSDVTKKELQQRYGIRFRTPFFELDYVCQLLGYSFHIHSLIFSLTSD